MSTSANTGAPRAPRAPPRYATHEPSDIPIKTQYLVMYNIISFLAWLSLFLRMVVPIAQELTNAPLHMWPDVGLWAMGVQSVAIIEVLHALFGVVRAPVLTTAMQVASRLFLLWGVCWMFGSAGLLKERDHSWTAWERLKGTAAGVEAPYLAINQLAFMLMLIAWGAIDAVRYMYFIYYLANQSVGHDIPKWLTWWRYNAFFLLYPIGISCECWLIYNAIPFAKELDIRYAYLLMAVLVIYVPGSYTLFTYMMKQRRKIIKGKQKAQ